MRKAVAVRREWQKGGSCFHVILVSISLMSLRRQFPADYSLINERRRAISMQTSREQVMRVFCLQGMSILRKGSFRINSLKAMCDRMLSSQRLGLAAMRCILQLNRGILLDSTSEIPMARSERKKEATQRIQQIAIAHSESIPTFCSDLTTLINSWIEPARRHGLIPAWSFKVIPVACPLLGKPEKLWVSFARQTKLFPSRKDLRVRSRLCQKSTCRD